MYSVSEEYFAKMFDQIQTHKLSGTVDGVSFDESDVIGVSYANRCAEKKVALGSVNIGTLKLTLLNDILNRGEYFGKTITLSDSLYLGLDENDQEVWETVPIGTFYIASATWTAAGIDITAYDCLSKMDGAINLTSTTAKIYGFCQYIATETGTTFGMSQQEVEALPNGDEAISPYEEANFETFRDLLSALAQMVGGFAYADRDGTWKLRPFNGTSVVTVPKNRRMSGSEFSDYETYYDTVKYTDVVGKVVRYAGDGQGQVMDLGSQPFLQYGVLEARERRAEAIANSIKAMEYTPFHISMLPASIALDLGDVISMSDDYSGTTSKGAVMEFSWTYNKSFSAYCYGDNPKLQDAQSKTDKQISGILNTTAQNEVTFYNYTNLEEIEVADEDETVIASIAFTAAQTTTVKIMHEFLMDMVKDLTTDGSYELHYYLDNELLTYKPKESLAAINGTVVIPSPEEGQDDDEYTVGIDPIDISITRDFFYVIRNVSPNVRHKWVVTITTHGLDSMTIGEQNAHVCIEGQRLYSEDYFDGLVEISEDIGKFSLVGMGVKSMTETVAVDTETAETIDISENITLVDLVGIAVTGMNETLQIVKTWLPLATENHILIKTEDGKLIRVEM